MTTSSRAVPTLRCASCTRLNAQKSTDVSDQERLELWGKLYNAPGFGKWLGAFSDTYTSREANKLY